MTVSDDLATLRSGVHTRDEFDAALDRVEAEIARLERERAVHDAEHIAANAERDASDEAAATWATLLAEAQLRAEAAEAEIARLQRHPDAWSERAFDQQKARAVAAEAEAARTRDGLRDVLRDLETGDPSAALSRTRALLADQAGKPGSAERAEKLIIHDGDFEDLAEDGAA